LEAAAGVAGGGGSVERNPSSVDGCARVSMETEKCFGPGLWPLAVRWQLDVNREKNMGIPTYRFG
jgi:hypothetical protein